ncbi:MAG: YggT family protein [Chloroflexi bacterium]|nr:YggT family protein [Chloroflexota bacterium]
MFGGGYRGESLASQVVYIFVWLLTAAIIVRALLSWFNLDPRSPLIQALNSITDPIIEPIRRIMPRIAMIDFSPLVAILLLQFISDRLQRFLG